MWKRTGISVGGGLLWAIALSGCGTLSSSSPPCALVVNNSNPPAVVNSGVVRSLQRHVQERDKRIAELEHQLDALKVIDQDMQNLRKSSRQPATLTPSE